MATCRMCHKPRHFVNNDICNFWGSCSCWNEWLNQKTAYNCLADAVQDLKSSYCNELLKSLLENNTQTASEDIHVRISQFIAQNNVEALDKFLTKEKIDLTEFDVFGILCPHETICAKIVEILLKHNAIVNFDYDRSTTILHWACQKNDLRLVHLLCTHGNADINITNEDYCTPIEYALRNKHKEITEYLIKCGAILPDDFKEQYKQNTKKENLHFLANTDPASPQSWTNLSEAVYRNDIKTSRKLLESNFCQVDVLTLYCAVCCENLDLFYLIWCGASASVLEKATKFMNLAFCSWVRPGDVTRFKIVLSTNFALSLKNCGRSFVEFIRNVVLSDVSEEVYELIRMLAQRNLRLTSKHFLALVEYTWDKTACRRRLLEYILAELLPNVTASVLLNSFSRELNDMLAPYCLEMDADAMFKLICHCNPDEMLQIYAVSIKFFTLPEHKYENLYKLVIEIDKKMATRMARQPRRTGCVKSLVELSRDKFRSYLRKFLYNTRQFIKYLEQLSVPDVIKNILRLKTALYT